MWFRDERKEEWEREREMQRQIETNGSQWANNRSPRHPNPCASLTPAPPTPHPFGAVVYSNPVGLQCCHSNKSHNSTYRKSLQSLRTRNKITFCRLSRSLLFSFFEDASYPVATCSFRHLSKTQNGWHAAVMRNDFKTFLSNSFSVIYVGRWMCGCQAELNRGLGFCVCLCVCAHVSVCVDRNVCVEL